MTVSFTHMKIRCANCKGSMGEFTVSTSKINVYILQFQSGFKVPRNLQTSSKSKVGVQHLPAKCSGVDFQAKPEEG